MTESVRLPLTHRIARHPYSQAQWVAVDVIFAVLFGAGFIVRFAMKQPAGPSGNGWDVTRYLLVVVLCVLLPLRRRRPVPVATALTVLSAFALCIGVPPNIFGPAALALYTVSANLPRRRAVSQLYLQLAAVVIGSSVGSWTAGTDLVPALIAGTAVIAAFWLAGENTRSHREYAKAVAERAADQERQREDRVRRASNDERVRIARELHDIVAHSMSVIAVRAGVARVVMDSHPNEAREALTLIETVTRTALQEMRLLVGVLRQSETPAGGSVADLHPAPGVADLKRLIADVGQAGVEVELVLEGEVRQLAPGVDLSVFRIVQEALTNTVRHVGPSKAQVRLSFAPRELLINVTDQGRPGAGAPKWSVGSPSRPAPDGRAHAATATAASTAQQELSHGGGHGLIGMRERAALFGGDLCAGPMPAGGFSVTARVRTDEAGG